MHAGIGFSLFHRRLQQARQFIVNRVHHLGPVEGDPGNPAVLFIKHLVHDGSPFSTRKAAASHIHKCSHRA